jgi:stress-induced morphogen
VPTTEEVKSRIEQALPGAEATVTDLTGGGDHLRAEVAYDGFAGLSLLEQHRLVYDVFGNQIGGPIHALSIKTVIPLDRNDGGSEGAGSPLDRNDGSSEGAGSPLDRNDRSSEGAGSPLDRNDGGSEGAT